MPAGGDEVSIERDGRDIVYDSFNPRAGFYGVATQHWYFSTYSEGCFNPRAGFYGVATSFSGVAGGEHVAFQSQGGFLRRRDKPRTTE